MFNTLQTSLTLGVGLIGIGREWGHVPSDIPEEAPVQTFLQTAYDLGITYYDTAPSYGSSERRLGSFLATLTEAHRSRIIVSTKFGEHWDTKRNTAYVDHSFEALKRSLDESIKLLTNIDLLYLHKASIEALSSPDVERAFEYAKAIGIKNFGASVSNDDAAAFVCTSDLYSAIQLPYNQANTQFSTAIDSAKKRNKIVIINRPFNMGSMLYANTKTNDINMKVSAYKSILMKDFHGAILTGTKSPEHLKENLLAFKDAQIELKNEQS